MNIATSGNCDSDEHVFFRGGERDIAKQSFEQENDMTPRLFVITVMTAMAIAGGAVAASHSNPASIASTASDSVTRKELRSAITLDKVSNPTTTLANAKVDDRQGHTLGPVKSVITGSTGAPTAIHVDVGGWLGTGEHIVSMDAKNFTYVPDKHILLTRMTKAEVQKLPVVHG